MEPWKVIIPLKAKAKGRPRFNGRYAYTPKATREYEKELRYWLFAADGRQRFEGPLRVSMIFTFKRPRKPKHEKYPISRPDVDNLAKGVADSMNGICLYDDAQICSLEVLKIYGAHDQIEITVTRL